MSSKNLVEAERNLREAIATRESIKNKLVDDTYKVYIGDRGISKWPYLNLQRVLIAKNQPAAALEIAERGRARVFVERLAKTYTTTSASTGNHRRSAPSF